MRTRSIYTNNDIVTKNRTPKEVVSRMAMEVSTIENLQTMGFSHSNEQDLQARRTELEQMIQQIKPAPVRRENNA